MQNSSITKFNITLIKTCAVMMLMIILPELSHASVTHTVKLNNETETEIEVYKANGNTLFLWLYSEAGPQPGEDTIAKKLAQKGIEVWRVDLFAAHFLPLASSSMDRIPETDFSILIEAAYKKTGKKIIPVTTGRGSLPVLLGARHWQQLHVNSRALSGVILMSPKFYIETPDPGEVAKLLPVVKQTNLPIFILQPIKSPWYWKLDQTIPALEKSGSDVFVQRIKGVRDRYYFRPDADELENKITQRLPADLVRAANYLNALPYKQRQVVKTTVATMKVQQGKKERSLKPYQGNPQPPELVLNDLNNKTIDLKNLTGRVVLVNFWASWCPPCVHEMPSMQRLQDRFTSGKFTILGVNMAEDAATIKSFLTTRVSVKFPIIMDQDGAALKRWHVFAFPTSYVIDKKGHIRYALFGGVDWETPDILDKITQLTKE
jgi:thiol-disulfide isomerase/thioredoxin